MSHASKTSHGTAHSNRRGSRSKKDSQAAQIRAQRAKAAGMDEEEFSPEKKRRGSGGKKKKKNSLDSSASAPRARSRDQFDSQPAFKKVENIKIDGWD